MTADPTALTGCDAAAQDEATCVGPYLADFGKRAYRRPLTGAEQDGLLALLARDAGTVDYPTRLAMVVQAVLLSPKFLFRPEIGELSQQVAQGVPLTSWEMATRLSYFLTGSIPDAELAGAADADNSRTSDELVKQARRLLTLAARADEPGAVPPDVAGDGHDVGAGQERDAFPDFNPLLAYYMAQGDGYVPAQDPVRAARDVRGAAAGRPHLRERAAGGVLRRRRAAGDDDWDPVQLDPSKRVGLLTQGSVLATMAKEDRTDPVRRGKFVLNQILCRTVTPPPPEIVAMFKPLDLSKTAREQLTQHRNNPVCVSCHQLLDPLGLPFEHYDGIGRWRDDDRGMALDVTGDARRHQHVRRRPADGAAAVQMPEARACYAAQWLRFSQGQLNPTPTGPYVDWLMTRFRATRRSGSGDGASSAATCSVTASTGGGRAMRRHMKQTSKQDVERPSPSAASRARCRGARCSRARSASAWRCPGWS